MTVLSPHPGAALGAGTSGAPWNAQNSPAGAGRAPRAVSSPSQPAGMAGAAPRAPEGRGHNSGGKICCGSGRGWLCKGSTIPELGIPPAAPKGDLAGLERWEVSRAAPRARLYKGIATEQGTKGLGRGVNNALLPLSILACCNRLVK